MTRNQEASEAVLRMCLTSVIQFDPAALHRCLHLVEERKEMRCLLSCQKVLSIGCQGKNPARLVLCLANQRDALNIYPGRGIQLLGVIECKEPRPTSGGRDKVEIP